MKNKLGYGKKPSEHGTYEGIYEIMIIRN